MPEVEATVVPWRHKYQITSAWELQCETIPLLASSLSRYCKPWLVLCCWSMESKIKYFCSKTLQIIAVRLAEPEFIHIKLFKCKIKSKKHEKLPKIGRQKLVHEWRYDWRTRERGVDRVYVLPKTVTGWRKVIYGIPHTHTQKKGPGVQTGLFQCFC